MADVVTLHPKDSRIWVCVCGCSTFSLCADGTIYCANCGHDHSEGAGWRERLGDDAAPDDLAEWQDVQGNGSIEFAKARLRRMATRDDAKMVAVALGDGSVSVWADAETDEQTAWALDRLSDAEALIRKQGQQ